MSLGGWRKLWGVEFDCYAELIQYSEHLWSPLILNQCSAAILRPSLGLNTLLMKRFYSCKKSARTLFVRTGNSENVFQLWIMVGEAVRRLRWEKSFSVARVKATLIDDPEDKMTGRLRYKGKPISSRDVRSSLRITKDPWCCWFIKLSSFWSGI